MRITCIIVFPGIIYAADTAKIIDIKGNTVFSNPADYQKQIDKIEKDIQDIKEKINQNLSEGCNRNIQTVNSLITWIGIVATMFAVIIAIGGFFIGWESIRSRQKGEEAIKTLGGAKSFITEKTTEFDKIMKEKLTEIDKFFNLALEQLSQDTEIAARKLKEKEEKGITTEAEKKVELLEKRIKFFEEVGLPDDPKLLYSKAMVCKEKDMLKESLELLEKAVQFDPQYKEAYWQIGWIQTTLKNYEKSLVAYTQVIKLDPKDGSAYNNKGVALSRMGKKEEALECYNKAIELDSKQVLYYINKAEVLRDLGRYEEALEPIKEAIKLDPKNTQLYRENAQTLLKLGKIKDAISNFDRAIEIEPDNESNYWKNARVLTSEGKLEDSLRYYKKAGDIHKNKVQKPDADEGDWLNSFENLLILGEYKEAVSIKTKLEEKIKSDKYLSIFNLNLACLYFLQKDKTNGFRQISHILESFEKSPPEKPTTWIFADINPFLKSKLPGNIYQVCITVEKMLLKEISPDGCQAEIEKLKAKV